MPYSMLKPILHIGFPKTGSTWFHTAYYKNVKNICLPEPENFLNQIAESSFVAPVLEKNTRLVLQHPELTGIKNFIWDNGIRRDRIAQNLKKYFPDATIVIFIRNQLEFLTSAYIYYVRKGGTYTSKKMIDLMIAGKMPLTLDFMIYNDTIERYCALFGRENVHIYLFEDFFASPEKFISEYSKRYDFEVDPGKINFKPVNDKMRSYLMKSMRISNFFTKRENPLKHYYWNCEWIYNNINLKYHKINQFRIFGGKIRAEKLFRPDQIKYFEDYYGPHNNKLMESFQLNKISTYAYPLSNK